MLQGRAACYSSPERALIEILSESVWRAVGILPAESENARPNDLPARRRICVERAIVAQSCTLSVSLEIVAGRDDFAERGSVSRSTLGATAALDL